MDTSIISGGGGGGLSPGANIETSLLLTNDSVQVPVSLDVNDAAQVAWIDGFTIAPDNTSLISPVKGRYLLTANSPLSQHATLWNFVQMGAWADSGRGFGIADPTILAIPPVSVADAGWQGISILYTTYVELAAGTRIWLYGAQLTANVPTANMRDIYFQIQYVGLATSF